MTIDTELKQNHRKTILYTETIHVSYVRVILFSILFSSTYFFFVCVLVSVQRMEPEPEKNGSCSLAPPIVHRSWTTLLDDVSLGAFTFRYRRQLWASLKPNSYLSIFLSKYIYSRSSSSSETCENRLFLWNFVAGPERDHHPPDGEGFFGFERSGHRNDRGANGGLFWCRHEDSLPGSFPWARAFGWPRGYSDHWRERGNPYSFTSGILDYCYDGTPDHLLLDMSPNIGPFISRWELDKFKIFWQNFRSFGILTLMYQQFSNLLISQRDMSRPRSGALYNNRGLEGRCLPSSRHCQVPTSTSQNTEGRDERYRILRSQITVHLADYSNSSIAWKLNPKSPD